ncbi:MAG: tetratricopeptide repeat protein [Acidobacteriota bacterium]
MITAISLALLLFAVGANSAPLIPATAPVSYEDSQLTAGRQAYAIQEYERAVTLLKAYVEKKPKDYEGHLYLGMSYRELKRFDDATAALETAVNLRSKSTQVQFELGQTYLAAKKYDAAMKQYQWLEKKDKQLAVEFRLSIPAEIAKQYKLPPSLLDQWQAELDAAQPIYPMSSQLRPTLTYKEKAMYTVEARDKKVQGTVVLSIRHYRE